MVDLLNDVTLFFCAGFGLATTLYWVGYGVRSMYYFMKG